MQSQHPFQRHVATLSQSTSMLSKKKRLVHTLVMRLISLTSASQRSSLLQHNIVTRHSQALHALLHAGVLQ